ncbi:hypothetical protein [Brevundimonas lutea]|uniref:hypothetical protein n=1 Tax=Brevundimonas lutea TaxID=2293980 RepID=UPI000F019BEE|nr:hypothetical protein [Brevundimonas lutea]
MAANPSRAKQLSRAEDRRLAGLARYQAPGWRLDLGPPERFVPDKTLLGFLQRGQTVLLRCQRKDCGRRVEPDIEALVRSGYGHLSSAVLQEALSCSHPLGCGLARPVEAYPRGVPLIAYLGHDGLMISITCVGCRRAVTLTVPAMIDRLIASGRGDASTGMQELARCVRGPCRNCAGGLFEPALLWPQAPGSGA